MPDLDSLFDANVWVALAFSTHPHHALAKREFEAADSAHPMVFCRVTQQAFLRHVTSPKLQAYYGSGEITNEAAWQKWEQLMALPQIVWMDEPKGLETCWRNYGCLRSASPKVWMDAYLAAFAVSGGLRLVTLDGDFKTYEAHGLNCVLLNP